MSDDKTPSNLPIPINARGQMVARDNAELVRMIQTMMQGQAFPKTLDTPQKAIAAWQVATSLGIEPAVAMQNMAVINGSVAIWGQLPKALAEKTRELEHFRQVLIDKEMNEINLANKNLNAEAWACVVQIRRKGRQENEYFFSLDDAKKAGLLSKSGPWRDYTRTMLARRTIGMAIKFEFPDALMGVPVAEYDLHQAPDLKDVTPLRAPAAEVVDNFNKMLNEEPNATATDDQPDGREGNAGPGGTPDRNVQVHREGLQDELASDERS